MRVLAALAGVDAVIHGAMAAGDDDAAAFGAFAKHYRCELPG